MSDINISRSAQTKPSIPRGFVPLPCGPNGNPSGVKLGEKITFTTLLDLDGQSCAVTYHGAAVTHITNEGLVVNVPADLAVTWVPAERV